MPRRLGLPLLIVGLLIVCISILALAYAFWPVDVVQVEATLAPTLLAPP
jgi:hypothetical protein